MPGLTKDGKILCVDSSPLSAWVAETATAQGLGDVPIAASLEGLTEVVSDVDVLFLAGSPDTIRGALEIAAEHGKDELLIFDFCEVKESHQEWVDAHLPLRLHYISLSVFAFSLDCAVAERFVDASVVLVPSMATRPEAIERALAFWEKLGAHVFQRLPHEHDALHAAGAQVPALLSGAYLSAVSKLFEHPTELQAMGVPELQMLSDLALGLEDDGGADLDTNRDNVIAVLEATIGELNDLKDRLASHGKKKVLKTSWAGTTRKNALGFAQEPIDS